MKLHEVLNKNTTTFLVEMPKEDIAEAEQVLNHVFMQHMGLKFRISVHFDHRMVPRAGNDPDNENVKLSAREDDVTKSELYSTFKKMIQKYKNVLLGKKQFNKEIECVVMDDESKVNIVFKIAYQFKDKYPMLKVITIRRRPNFKARPNDMILKV